MTSEYDELLARLGKVNESLVGDMRWHVTVSAAMAIRALTAQVVERDAVIEQVRKWRGQWNQLATDLMELDELDAALSQAPRDALAARDAVRDKTVRATALRDVSSTLRRDAELLREAGDVPASYGQVADIADSISARADQEEGKNDR